MTDRERPGFEDEVVIGGTPSSRGSAPASRGELREPPGAIGAGSRRVPSWDESPGPSDEVIGYEDDLYYGDEYYDGDYYDDEPARQPLFYVFIALALVLGAVLVFLLFRLLADGGDEPAAPGPEFNISIDSPLNDERVNSRTDVNVQVRANATEPIRTLQLLLEGSVVDEEQFSAPPENGIYSATLSFQVPDPGSYQLVARAISESGATRDSQAVRLIAVERIDDRPSRVTGEVVSTVNARQGPGDQFTAVATINAGQVVAVIGRTRDNQWLLLEDETWIRRAAVQLSDSLDLVDVREPTPVPAPTATEAPRPSPSPSASPSADSPDFSPTNAAFDKNGTVLRVTVSNLSSHAYQGPLVVRVTGLGNVALEQAFSVNVGANGSQAVEFTLASPQQSGVTVQVTVDAAGQVKESSEDNNAASFVLAAPVSAPEIVIADASILDGTIRVTITNVGSDLPASDVVVTVSLGGSVNSASRSGLALAFGDSQSFTVVRPEGSGVASITVRIGGQEVTSGTIDIPGANNGTPTATPTP